jgi:fermentation-respiration switch protein FrsA (DUF1100 family)
VAAGAGLAAVEVALQVGQGNVQPRRAAVDDGDQRRTMALAGGGDGEQLAEGIAGHQGAPRISLDRERPLSILVAPRQFIPPRTAQNLCRPPASISSSSLTPEPMLRLLPWLLLLFIGAIRAEPLTVLQRPIELNSANATLHGSLLLPKSTRPVPVVLMIAGSGPTDRDGNNPFGGHNDSLKLLALDLARQGIASVRYDKRGIAPGDDESRLSVEGYVADVVAWSRMLRADNRFGRLILLGHSEGALIASLAAPEAGACALVTIAGSARPIDQVLREQLRPRLSAPLFATSSRILDSLKAGQPVADVPKELLVLYRPSVQPYLISLFRQHPAEAFARLDIPALIVQGTHDIQVDVSDAQLLKAARPDAQLLLISGMNHVLRIVPTDLQAQLASYDDPQLPLADGLVSAIARFIQSNDKVPAFSEPDNCR